MKRHETNMKELLTTYLTVEEEKIETKLLQDPVETPVFDKTFYEKLDQAAEKEQKKPSHKKHTIPKVAAACAFLLLVTCLMNPVTRTYATDAFDHLFTWLKQEGPQGTDIYTLENKSRSATTEMTHIIPKAGYIPEGFVYSKDRSFIGQDMFTYDYVKDPEDPDSEYLDIDIQYLENDTKVALNNEWDSTETITINGIDYTFGYYFLEKENWGGIYTNALYQNKLISVNYSCSGISSFDDKKALSKKELIKIIKHLEF